jgi:hypothetical protein
VYLKYVARQRRGTGNVGAEARDLVTSALRFVLLSERLARDLGLPKPARQPISLGREFVARGTGGFELRAQLGSFAFVLFGQPVPLLCDLIEPGAEVLKVNPSLLQQLLQLSELR